MKIYHLTRHQFLPASLQQAWDFFSSPQNLALITPKRLRFNVLDISSDRKLHNGQIIRYTIMILPGIRWKWVTEITDVHEPHHFSDEQRSGPYRYWRHVHHFREVPGGIEMTDKVDYIIPFGILGRLANNIFVAREVNAIFDYRYTVLEQHFVKNNHPAEKPV